MLNVPCTGKFYITVLSDGFWEVRLEHKDGDVYYRSRGTMLRPYFMITQDASIMFELPDWMWEATEAKIAELQLAFDRNALHTPEIKNVVV